MVDEIKLVYSTHKGIPDNETPDSLTIRSFYAHLTHTKAK